MVDAWLIQKKQQGIGLQKEFVIVSQGGLEPNVKHPFAWIRLNAMELANAIYVKI